MSAAERPEPGSLDPTWSYLSIPGGSYYNFEMYRSEGLDSLNFVNIDPVTGTELP